MKEEIKSLIDTLTETAAKNGVNIKIVTISEDEIKEVEKNVDKSVERFMSMSSDAKRLMNLMFEHDEPAIKSYAEILVFIEEVLNIEDEQAKKRMFDALNEVLKTLGEVGIEDYYLEVKEIEK